MRLPRFVQYWRVGRRFDRKSKFSQGSGSRSAATLTPGCQPAPRAGLTTAAAEGLTPADVPPIASAGALVASARPELAPGSGRATAEPGLERLALPEEIEWVVSRGRAQSGGRGLSARPSGPRAALGTSGQALHSLPAPSGQRSGVPN